MSRYIDADALLDAMWKMLYAIEDKAEKDFVGTDKHDEWFYNDRPWLQRGHEIAVIAVNDAPTADVAPVVHGKWIRGRAYPHHIFCSNCYRTYVPNDETEMWKDQTRLPRNYCPECGAKMDEVSE